MKNLKVIYSIASVFFLVGLTAANSNAQNLILNPGFENHALSVACYTNQTEAQVTSALDNVTAFYFGTDPGIDIGVGNACYAGGANSGTTHIVLARLYNEQMSEAFSFDLSTPIVAGATYNISFYAANSNIGTPESLLIGISGSQTTFGTQAVVVPLGNSAGYVQYSTTFTAPVGGAYLTVQPQLSSAFWFGLDDFYLENNCTPSGSNLNIPSCGSYTVPSGDETYTASGIYYDTLPNAGGCDSILTIDLTINPIPFISGNPDMLICDGDQVTLSGGGGQMYTWSAGLGTIIYDGVPFVPTATDTYIVYGTDGNGCSSSDTVLITVVDCWGVDELDGNPSKQLVKITDLMGRETQAVKNTPLIYIYSDGTVKRVFEFE